jgi:septum formation protein
MGTDRIVLASQSPRRKQLLEWAEVDFDIIAHPTDESYPARLPVEEIPVYIARQKALAVQQSEAYKRYEKNPTIVAADTIVVLQQTVLGKPTDRADAITILQMLSGKKHQVITGVVILKNGKETAFHDTTDVTFYQLSTEQITYYVDKYQPYDKAGAYAIQEWIGVTGIKNIRGDFYNVMGLPVSRVVQQLSLQ